MALVHPDIICPICDKRLGEDDSDILSFTFLAVDDRDFGAFDDSACHRSCLSRWARRDDFIAFWNARMIYSIGADAAQLRVNTDGRVEWQDSDTVKQTIAMFLAKKK
ncbi:MAG: hypothetical protein WC708_06965 [Lentisphaeria bacterium]